MGVKTHQMERECGGDVAAVVFFLGWEVGGSLLELLLFKSSVRKRSDLLALKRFDLFF